MKFFKIKLVIFIFWIILMFDRVFFIKFIVVNMYLLIVISILVDIKFFVEFYILYVCRYIYIGCWKVKYWEKIC